jgi:hypothetical protein
MIKELVLNSNHSSFGNLLWSHSITSTSSGDIIIVDSLENRLLFFNKEFIFKYHIGSKGKENGEFDEPTDAVLSETGKLYISDKNNFRVQIYSESKIKNKGVSLASSQFSKQSTELDLKKTKTKIFKTSNEFTYFNSVLLEDKPVKLASSPFNNVMAVSTENGLIFILNSLNQTASYLKIKKPFDSGDLNNIILNDMGNILYFFRQYENKITLRVYDTGINEKLSNPSNQINKMSLLESFDIEKNYMPGICLCRIGIVKISLDLKNFLIYDALNINLLEYDLKGNFKRIVLKAEERLGNLLAFDFSGDRQHLISYEVHFNRRKIPNQSKKFISSEQHQRNISMSCLFKLRTYKHANCECHRNMNKKENLNDFAKNNQFNQSYHFLSNEPSITTFSKSNYNL